MTGIRSRRARAPRAPRRQDGEVGGTPELEARDATREHPPMGAGQETQDSTERLGGPMSQNPEDTLTGMSEETVPPPSPFERRLSDFVVSHSAATLSDELHRRAGTEIDVAWSTHDSPVGPLLLAFHHDHLVRVAFEREGFDGVVEAITTHLGARTLHTAAPANDARRQLDEYFVGERVEFDLPVDLRLSTAPFRRLVQSHLAEIPYATTVSYSDVAEGVGRPQAVRAVGSACAHNPLPVVLPCHRVVRRDGSFGHYLGGSEAKAFLLDHERAHAPAPS